MQRAEQIGRRLKLRHLNVLLAVIEEGSMVKAAERLAITQPVVSKTISDLENLVGVRLLDRGPQGIEPTLYGRALLKRSVSIFDDLMASINELESLADPGTGEVRIGCTEAAGAAIVPSMISRLSRQYPRMTFEVFLADPATLLDRYLRGRRVDLIVGPFTPDTDDDIKVTVLHQRDRLQVVSGPSNPWVNRRKVALSDLCNEPWVLPPPSHPVGAMVIKAFRQIGLQPPRNVVTVTSAQFTTRLIADGRFLGVLASAGLKDPFHALEPVRVELPKTTWTMGIATLKDRTLGPTTELFIGQALEFVKLLAKNGARRRV
jgi:DNA-binding transcriptional LysR family regulator